MLPADVPRDAVIVTRNLKREYDMGGEIVRALRGVDLAIRRNEFVAIMGPSGSGKSTLMNLIGCLDTPTAGEYWLNGHRVSRAGRRRAGPDPQPGDRLRLPDVQPAAARDRAAQRRAAAGLRRRGSARSGSERAAEALERVGLGDRMDHRPERALRRPAPARRHRAGAGEQARASSWPTSRPATSTRTTSEEIMALFEELHATGPDDHPGHPRARHRRARPPPGAPEGRQGRARLRDARPRMHRRDRRTSLTGG